MPGSSTERTGPAGRLLASAAVETQTFYTTVGSISFTLLGLWWVVVQGRESWRTEPSRRRMAYAVSLHFLLPGAMSILSLVAPDLGLLWRVTFATAGVLGAISAIYVVRTLREEHDSPRIARVIELIAVPIYALVAVIALFPELINGLGIGLTALQAEAIILSILVFFGVQAAWILMVEPLRADAAAHHPEGPPS